MRIRTYCESLEECIVKKDYTMVVSKNIYDCYVCLINHKVYTVNIFGEIIEIFNDRKSYIQDDYIESS